MIGQEKLFTEIDKLIISGFPHSIILTGDHEAGQLDVCKYIASRLNAELIDITDRVTLDTINQIYLNPNVSLYVANLSELSEKEQSILLKVFEEPNVLTYIVLFRDTESEILDTLVNRGRVLKMDDYPLEVLKKYTNNELILSLCTTPKQIEIATHTNIEALFKLCETIITKMKVANFDNALTISNKINFNDEYNKFDIYLFYKVLAKKSLELNSVITYEYLSNMMKYIYLIKDKKSYFEHFIISLWKESRK